MAPVEPVQARLTLVAVTLVACRPVGGCGFWGLGAALAGLAPIPLTSAMTSTAGSRTSHRRRPGVMGFMECSSLGRSVACGFSSGSLVVAWSGHGGCSSQVDEPWGEEAQGLGALCGDPEVHGAGGQRRRELGRHGREPVDADRDAVVLDGDLDLVVVAGLQRSDRQDADPLAD